MNQTPPNSVTTLPYRAVVRFWNPRVLVIMGAHNLPPPVGIGLTELPNSGGAKAPSAPPLTTALRRNTKRRRCKPAMRFLPLFKYYRN